MKKPTYEQLEAALIDLDMATSALAEMNIEPKNIPVFEQVYKKHSVVFAFIAARYLGFIDGEGNTTQTFIDMNNRMVEIFGNEKSHQS